MASSHTFVRPCDCIRDFGEPLESYDFIDVLLDMNDSDFILDIGMFDRSLFSQNWMFSSKIDMLTCRSVQASSFSNLSKSSTLLMFF